jgi:Pyruvate/2-oxoacid:ferredoxin oxidoreductase delta subunit
MTKPILCDSDKCTGCEACNSICPESSIKMIENSEGFLQPTIDDKICTGCKKCERVCPVLNRPQIGHNVVPDVFACWHRNNEIRLASSSGGVFSALAEMVLDQGGVVFGAAYDENLGVYHKWIDKLDDLDSIRRSKYVQSRIGDTFREVKNFLSDNRKVLFVGTPCQIAGLFAFLGGDKANLLAVDFICHGVPSPKVFKKYLESIERDSGRQFTDLNFRDKRRGWLNNTVVGTSSDKKHIILKGGKNSYYNAFVVGTFLRKPCYQCPVIGMPRFGNVTIADFWGIQADSIIPQKEIDKGISLLMVNDPTMKKMIFEGLSEKLFSVEKKLSDAQQGNTPMCTPSKLPANRTLFFNDLDRYPYSILADKYLKPSLKRRFDQLIKENCSTGLINKFRIFQNAFRKTK